MRNRTISVPVLSVLLSALFFTPLPAAVVDIEGMVPRNPKPPAAHIINIDFLNDRWIVLSEKGLLTHGTDGETWSTVALPYDKGLNDVIYWKGRYYVCGADNRYLFTSTDLVNWDSQRPSGFLFNPKQFVVIGERLYCAGWSNGLAYTEDGENWTQVELPETTRWDALAFNDDRFVMVGGNGLIISSEDAENWTVRVNGITGLEGIDDDFIFVSWVNGRFVAGGKEGLVMTSLDGISWELADTAFGSWLYGVTFEDGAYYFPGRNSLIHRTTDFVNWTDVVVTDEVNSTIQYIASSGTAAVAGGRDGFIAISDDFMNWTPTSNGSNAFFYDIEYGNDVYVTVEAQGGIWMSNDSESWIAVHQVADGDFIRGLVFDGSQFVGVTDEGAILTSPDGESWTAGGAFEGDPQRLRFINGTYWAVGDDGLIASSTNLSEWSLQTVGEEDLNDIAFGAGQLVVVGDAGTILSSPNGSSWTPFANDVTNDLKAVAFGGGQFVVLGRSSNLFRSPDGLNWSHVAENGNSPFDAQRVEYIEDRFVSVGYLGRGGISLDGENWEFPTARINQTLYDFVVTEDRTVAVGVRGSILSTPVGLPGAYLEWAELRFNPSQLEDPEFWEPGADPDEDGRVNAFEYFSNTPPLVADEGSPYTFYLRETSGQLYPVFEVIRQVDVEDASIGFFVMKSATEWEALVPEAVILEDTIPLDTERELLRYRLDRPVQPDDTALLTVEVLLGN